MPRARRTPFAAWTCTVPSLPPVETHDAQDPTPEGFGCRPAALAFALLAVFVTVSAVAGVSLALRSGCEGVCEAVGFTLYAGALPISGVFAAVAGDLPIAWPLDATLWVIVALMLSRVAERRRVGVPRVVVEAIVVALLYGFTLSFFIEAVV